jgi:hypothetical protein
MILRFFFQLAHHLVFKVTIRVIKGFDFDLKLFVMLLEIRDHLGSFLKVNLTLFYFLDMLITLICHFLVQQSYLVFAVFELTFCFDQLHLTSL